MKTTLFLFISIFLLTSTNGQQIQKTDLPVRGLCIAAPSPDNLDRFIKFITEDLKQLNVNVLVLRIDYNFEYNSHPELRSDNPLTKNNVKELVRACKSAGIDIIPQINLLGHQSWHSSLSKLLEVYPQFDETPHVNLPEEYKWPNDDELYCKSYCPLHPDVHEIVFSLVDEIMDVFEAKAFHAGLDEVFYLGDDKCPRCSGRDKAELFAGEVWKIRNHLAQKNRKLWIWGDRLIDGKTTGMGMWEASMNNTARAIDMVPKDIVICDWHYERPDPTPVYFAMKGLDVITCPYRKPEVAIKQLHDMVNFRENSTPEMSTHFLGMMQTVWTGADNFLDAWYKIKDTSEGIESQANCFKILFEEINKME